VFGMLGGRSSLSPSRAPVGKGSYLTYEMKNGFDDVYWIRTEHSFGLVRLCIRHT